MRSKDHSDTKVDREDEFRGHKYRSWGGAVMRDLFQLSFGKNVVNGHPLFDLFNSVPNVQQLGRARLI